MSARGFPRRSTNIRWSTWTAPSSITGRPLLLEKMQGLPQLRDVASDQQSAGRTLNIEVNREAASRLGVDPALVDGILYDAFGQRHVARIYTTLNQYYVILEVDPELPAWSQRAQPHLCEIRQRHHGAAEPVRQRHAPRSRRWRSTIRASSRRSR